MSLQDLIREIFDENGKFEFNELQFQDQHRLAEAYILENEEIIFDLFSNVHRTSLARHFAKLHCSIENIDVFAMAEEIRNAITRSDDLQSLIDGEIDHQWRSYQSEREQTIHEAAYDAGREVAA